MEAPGLSSQTIRLTFSIAGQAVALKVMGSSATTYYLYNDHLGSTATMSTAGGGTVTGSTARYTPYGDWRTEPTANLTDRGFTGHMHQNIGSAPDDIGLIYMNARWFSPYLNRFISADSIVPDPTNPQSFNRYSYTNNNPINYVDPSGHAAQLIEGGDGNCQNSLDCVYWDKEIHGELYGRPIGTKLEDVAQAQEQMQETGKTVVGLLCEWCDWGIALSDGFQWYDGIGMLPIIPTSFGDNIGRFAARYSDEVNDVLRHLDDDEVLYQFSRPPRNGQFQGFPKDLRPGENGMSCQVASLCNYDPIQGFRQQFGQEPIPGDWVRETKVGNIRNWGGVVDVDGFPGNPMGNPIGHATIYSEGGWGKPFARIWGNQQPLVP